MTAKIYDIAPISAPRMTQSDKWKKPRRSCVQQYFNFRDTVNRLGVNFQNGDSVIFVLPMPDSWTAKKKATHDGKPHQQKPDVDNLLKALLDSIYGDDCHIWHIGDLKKQWGYAGCICVHTDSEEAFQQLVTWGIISAGGGR